MALLHRQCAPDTYVAAVVLAPYPKTSQLKVSSPHRKLTDLSLLLHVAEIAQIWQHHPCISAASMGICMTALTCFGWLSTGNAEHSVAGQVLGDGAGRRYIGIMHRLL